jgi:hypothetical protein
MRDTITLLRLCGFRVTGIASNLVESFAVGLRYISKSLFVTNFDTYWNQEFVDWIGVDTTSGIRCYNIETNKGTLLLSS